MFCCLFNSITTIFGLIGLTGVGMGWCIMYNKYLFLGLLLINASILGYFITQAVKDKSKTKFVVMMAMGFLLTNGSYFVKVFYPSKHCHHCPHKRSENGCSIPCKKNVLDNKLDLNETNQDISQPSTLPVGATMKQSFNSITFSKQLILSLFSMIGILLTVFGFILYRNSNHKKDCKTACKTDCKGKKKK